MSMLSEFEKRISGFTRGYLWGFRDATIRVRKYQEEITNEKLKNSMRGLENEGKGDYRGNRLSEYRNN